MFSRVPTKRNQSQVITKIAWFWLHIYKWIDAAERALFKPFLDRIVNGVAYPSIFKRVLAFAIDSMIVALLFLVINAVLLSVLSSQDAKVIVMVLTFFLTLPVYLVLVTIQMRGRTPGKAAFNLNVVSAKDNPLSALQIMLRETSKAMFITLSPLIVLGSLLNKRYRTINDLIASTQVVYSNGRGQLNGAENGKESI